MLSEFPLSSNLISSKDIWRALPFIFSDAIILDEAMIIQGASESVLEWTGYSLNELRGMSIDMFAEDRQLSELLRLNLIDGAFDELKVHLKCHTTPSIPVCLSGFYLGLVTDFNEGIALRVKNQAELSSLTARIRQKNTDLDEFIYRTSHDLRGPLATMQGLVNLMKVRRDNTEVDSLLQLLWDQAKKLDERLFRLTSLSKFEETKNHPSAINFQQIEKSILRIAAGQIAIQFSSPLDEVIGVNERQLSGLLENLILQIKALDALIEGRKVFIRVEQQENQLKMTIGIVGASVPECLARVITQEFSYSDTLKYPELFHFFAAKKFAAKLGTNIHSSFFKGGKHRIVVNIPLPRKIKS